MNTHSKWVIYGWLRIGLAALIIVSVVTGGWALFVPESFFTTFPLPGHPWVALLPPYNEHLVRDVGEFNLSFAFLFTWAAVTLERRLVQAVLLAWLVYAVPHFIYHLAHLTHFPFADQIGQTTSLGCVILLPLALLLALRYSTCKSTKEMKGKWRYSLSGGRWNKV